MARPSPSHRVVELDPTADRRWDAYVSGHARGVVFHHSAWLRSLGREYPQEAVSLAYEDAHGRLLGVLPLVWTRGLPLAASGIAGRRLSSLPRTPAAGPLADDRHAAAALVCAAVLRVRERAGARLQLKLDSSDLDGLVPGVVGHPWRSTYRIELPERVADVRFGTSRNHARIRWAVRKAEREHVRVRPAVSTGDVRAWYPLYVEALQRHAVPPRPLRLFIAMWEEMAPIGLMRLLLAERRREGVVAGSIILTLGATAFYAFNGVSRRALSARPNDAIQWRAIHDAVAMGCRRYDLGEVVEHHAGLADFKRKWGACEQRLHRYYQPAPAEAPDPGDGARSRPQRLAETAWRRMPPRATSLIGDVVYRYM